MKGITETQAQLIQWAMNDDLIKIVTTDGVEIGDLEELARHASRLLDGEPMTQADSYEEPWQHAPETGMRGFGPMHYITPSER